MSSISINYNQGRPHYVNGNRPVTLGSKSDDFFALNSKTKGLYRGGKGNDTFDYGDDLGRLNTIIRGGSGSDTFALSKLKFGEAINALKRQNYSFVQLDRGFALRTNDGQEIKVFNVEKIAFANKTLDLREASDLNALINAFKRNGINIIDETGKDNNRNDRHGQNRVRFAINHRPYQSAYHGPSSHPYSVSANHLLNNNPYRTSGNFAPSYIHNFPGNTHNLGAQQAYHLPYTGGFAHNSLLANPLAFTHSLQNDFSFNNNGFYPTTIPVGSYGHPHVHSPVFNYSHPSYSFTDPFGPNAIRVPASAILAHSSFGSGLTSTRVDRNQIYDFSNSTNNFNFYLNSFNNTYEDSFNDVEDLVIEDTNDDYLANDYDYSPVATPTFSYRPISYQQPSSININSNINSSSNSNSISIS